MRLLTIMLLGILIPGGVLLLAADKNDSVESLLGKVWLLEELDGRGTMDRVRTTLEFDTLETITGNGGCNRFHGPVHMKDTSIREIGPISSTMMACAKAVMDQEKQFMAALSQATRWEMNGKMLFIHHEGSDKPLKFSASRPRK